MGINRLWSIMPQDSGSSISSRCLGSGSSTPRVDTPSLDSCRPNPCHLSCSNPLAQQNCNSTPLWLDSGSSQLKCLENIRRLGGFGALVSPL